MMVLYYSMYYTICKTNTAYNTEITHTVELEQLCWCLTRQVYTEPAPHYAHNGHYKSHSRHQNEKQNSQNQFNSNPAPNLMGEYGRNQDTSQKQSQTDHEHMKGPWLEGKGGCAVGWAGSLNGGWVGD